MKGDKNIKGINNIKESFKTRQVKYGGYAALLTVAVIAGLILINLIVGQFAPQIDLTSNRLFSLSDQTIQVLDGINKPVKFYGLWRPGEENQDVMPVINLYVSKSKNISLEIIDPDKNPGFVMRYNKEGGGIARGSLIVEGEKGFKIISAQDMYDVSQSPQAGPTINGVSVERRITGALLYVGTGVTPVVYELSGHDEFPLETVKMKEIIERENLVLKSLNLLTTAVPKDASAIVINSPRKDLAQAEAEKILEYLEKGGRLIMLADYNVRELANFNMVLENYGIRFDYGIVHEKDPNYVALDPRTAWPDLTDHEITLPLADKGRTPVILFEAMSLSILEARRHTLEIAPLMVSSSSAFLRRDLDNTSEGKIPSDVSGPLMLGAAVRDASALQSGDAQARIVVIGSGSLLPLVLGGFDGNRDIFMNSLGWLQERPESISVRSKSISLLPLRLELVQIIVFALIFILIIPVGFFVGGFVNWLKRRHL